MFLHFVKQLTTGRMSFAVYRGPSEFWELCNMWMLYTWVFNMWSWSENMKEDLNQSCLCCLVWRQETKLYMGTRWQLPGCLMQGSTHLCELSSQATREKYFWQTEIFWESIVLLCHPSESFCFILRHLFNLIIKWYFLYGVELFIASCLAFLLQVNAMFFNFWKGNKSVSYAYKSWHRDCATVQRCTNIPDANTRSTLGVDSKWHACLFRFFICLLFNWLVSLLGQCLHVWCSLWFFTSMGL